MACVGFACCHEGINNLHQGLYRSVDQGLTWNQVATVNGGGQAIDGHSFTDIIYDGSATFYASVRFQGVYYSTDHGASWTQMPSPFPSGTAPSTDNFARGSLAFRGGKLWCLVADSNDVASTPVTGEDTGLSESDNGGFTWSHISLPSNIYSSGSVAQGTYDMYVAAPPGSTRLLVGGIDLWSANTVNGTSTAWSNLTNAYSPNPTSHPDQHAVAFVNANTWYIGNDGGVWSTQNTGNSISNLNNNLGTIQFYSVVPDPFNAGGAAGGSQDNGTAYTNGSNGTLWNQIGGGDGGYTEANPNVPGEFFGENFNIGLYRAPNFAIIIDTSYAPIQNDNSSILVPYKALPTNPTTIIMGTSRIWERQADNSSDGAGWSSISGSNNLLGNAASTATFSVRALDAGTSNPNYMYATTEDLTAGAYQVFSNSGGSTWSDVSSNLPTTNPIASVAVDPTNPVIAYVGVQGFMGTTGGHVFQTTNGGTSWTDISGNLPDSPVNWIPGGPAFPRRCVRRQ